MAGHFRSGERDEQAELRATRVNRPGIRRRHLSQSLPATHDASLPSAACSAHPLAARDLAIGATIGTRRLVSACCASRSRQRISISLRSMLRVDDGRSTRSNAGAARALGDAHRLAYGVWPAEWGHAGCIGPWCSSLRTALERERRSTRGSFILYSVALHASCAVSVLVAACTRAPHPGPSSARCSSPSIRCTWSPSRTSRGRRGIRSLRWRHRLPPWCSRASVRRPRDDHRLGPALASARGVRESPLGAKESASTVPALVALLRVGLALSRHAEHAVRRGGARTPMALLGWRTSRRSPS